MKTTNYRVVPLPTEVAEEARRAAQAGASDHAIAEADSPTGFPCRHCLQWAQPGERVVLFPYASVPPGRPYSESGPIFVHAEACERYAATDRYPENFRSHRVLRAYDSDHNMIDAIVVSDDQPEAVIEKLLRNPATSFLQARSVSRGCYTFRIERP
jgi:Protein of unknown function (DUF1203)